MLLRNKDIQKMFEGYDFDAKLHDKEVTKESFFNVSFDRKQMCF
jgi:hypothetical protein